MPNLSKYRLLNTRARALVAIAVLLDGHDAVDYLSCDQKMGSDLARAARDLAELSPELRMPLVGTLLRTAISEIEGGKQGT